MNYNSQVIVKLKSGKMFHFNPSETSFSRPYINRIHWMNPETKSDTYTETMKISEVRNMIATDAVAADDIEQLKTFEYDVTNIQPLE